MDLEARVDELMEAERWSDVIALLAEHEAITRADSTLAWTRGWAHYWLNELDAAEVWLRRAVERDGGSADAVFALARRLPSTAGATTRRPIATPPT